MAFVRRRPGNRADARYLALAFLAGVLAVFEAPFLPPPWWAVPAAVAVLPQWRLRWPCLFLAAGYLCAWGHAVYLLHDRLPLSLDGHTFAVTGFVDSLPQARPGRHLFLFQTAADAPRPLPRHLRISWYDYTGPALRAGQCWSLQVKLHSPRGLRNPGGFDYAGWLFRNDIGASGYVKHGQRCARNSWHPLLRLRQRLEDSIAGALAGESMRGMVLALTVGDRSGITQAQWRTLRATGTSHLVAISGLHIGIVAGAAYALLRWLWCWFPALCLRLAASRAAAIGAMGAAWLYALLAGLSLPTERAVIMISVAMTALLAGRVVRPSAVLGVALIAVLAIHPFAVGSGGFWLSFGAVAWLLYLLTARVGKTRGWRAWFGVQGGLLLALAPLTLLWFDQMSLAAPLANTVLIPLFGLLVPAILAGVILLPVPWLGAHWLIACTWVMGWLYEGLGWLSRMPYASLHAATSSVVAVCLALLGVVLLLMPRGLPGRWLGLVLCLPLLLPASSGLPPGAVRLTVLDVGQGLAVAIRTRHHTALFDTGPAYRGGFDAGRSVVVPFLRWSHVSRVDRLIVSHSDRDHRGGLAAVLRQMPVGRLQDADYEDPCRAGEHWAWDGVDFRILHPADRARWHSDNNESCVLRVRTGNHAALLTADIEAPAEHALVTRVGSGLHATVLIVPHHGSNTSSTPAFIAAVNPRWALISSGYHNQWGFPKADVVKRYREAGARVETTARRGALTVRLTPDKILPPKGWRVGHRRIWTPPATWR